MGIGRRVADLWGFCGARGSLRRAWPTQYWAASNPDFRVLIVTPGLTQSYRIVYSPGGQFRAERRIGAAEIWSCPRCECAQSVRFWAAADSVAEQPLGVARSGARQVAGFARCRVMILDHHAGTRWPVWEFCIFVLARRHAVNGSGAEAARWPGGEAA